MFFSFVFLNEQIEIIGKLLWYNRNKRRLVLLENNHIFSCFVFFKAEVHVGESGGGFGGEVEGGVRAHAATRSGVYLEKN